MTIYDLETARQDHFALFGLPRAQGIDIERLDAIHRDIQAKVHPDKHAHLPDTQKRMAMQWAMQVNEAWQTLRDPLRRARYLLELAGHDVAIERNTAMPTEFLVTQLDLREQIAEAKAAGDADALDALHHRLKSTVRAEHEVLRLALDAGEFSTAAAQVRQLMFQEKLLHEIDDALVALET